MSFRIVAFPYTPPADAAYAEACLPARPGTRVRVVRRAESWAIVESGGRLGLFPIVFTRDERQDRPLLRKARQELAGVASPAPEETTVLDSGAHGEEVSRAAEATPPLEPQHDANEGVVVPGASGHVSSNTSETGIRGPAGRHPHLDSAAGAGDEGGGAGVVASLPTQVRLCRVQRVSGDKQEHGPQYNRKGCGTLRGGGVATETPQRETEGEEDGRIACSRRGRVAGDEVTGQVGLAPQHARRPAQDGERDELQELRGQYAELDAELGWLSRVTAAVMTERQRVRDAHASDITERAAERQARMEELEWLARGAAAKDTELKAAANYIASLRSILSKNNVSGAPPGSARQPPPQLCTAPSPSPSPLARHAQDAREEDLNDNSEDEEEEEEDVPEPVEALARDAEATAEVLAIKTCIRHEQETLQNYQEQYTQLTAELRCLRRVQAAIEEESSALRESEAALEAVAPTGSYTVVHSSSTCDGGARRQSAEGGEPSAASPRGAGDVELVMRDGFTWPATLPGLTTEEQAAISNYQRLLHKYEAKLRKWEEEHGETREPKSSSVNEELRAAILTGDKALNELMQRTAKMKEFVTKYGAVAESLGGQVAVSQRALQRQQNKCSNALAAYEAAVTSDAGDIKT
ncbi:uncharacterized protein Tco025E_02455 [Trypanosoma conorhini]|uniref:SH3 domain-containing protein n=1 Tax=Trypanosoma conorhini TaxID=83891 RepID=A0A3R7LAK1_9TRYP|nr:uncharacterized protein Tco025E_02455 [Trypanosoma conorhini]RNF24485.1 hypothetical protein Tco025E_02455 [Trypanosoma conorhini]